VTRWCPPRERPRNGSLAPRPGEVPPGASARPPRHRADQLRRDGRRRAVPPVRAGVLPRLHPADGSRGAPGDTFTR
jgi:hypothetical protein